MAPSSIRLSIRARVALLIAAILVPVVAMFTWFHLDDVQRAREDARKEVATISGNAAANLEQFLSHTEAMLARLAARPQVRALDPKNCDPIVAEYGNLNPEFTTLGIRDLDGNSVCSYLPNPIPRLNAPDFPWFGEGLRAGKFYAGNALRGRQAGRWVSVLTYPVRSPSGQVAGLLALPVDLVKLSTRLLGSVPSNAVVAVADRTGALLLRSSEAGQYVGAPIPAAMEKLIRGQREGSFTGAGRDGVRRVFTYVTLPGVDWRLNAGLPEADVYAKYDARLKRNLAIGLGVLALALLIGWRLSRALIRPIDSLASVAGRVAAGESTARAELTGPAEVISVADGFNRMLDVRAVQEAALRASEESLSITLQSIGDAVIATDTEGRITRMNGTAERLTGWPLAEAAGRPMGEVFKIIHAETRLPAADPVQCVLESGEIVALVNRIILLSRDGREYRIFDSAAPIRTRTGEIAGVVLVFADVTQQQQVRQALEESERRFRTLIEMSPIPVRVHRHEQVIYVNPAAVRLLGAASAGQLTGESVLDRIHPASREAALARLRLEADGHFEARTVELTYTRLDGAAIEIEAQAMSIRFDGEPAVHATLIDITARKRAEAERQTLETQLRESQKMEAIGTLAGGIAHDFNNIIGTILGNVELARDDAGLEPAVQESLEEIRKAGHRARDLVQQILAFSRRQPTERKPISLQPVVAESVQLLRATLPARVEVASRISGTTEPVLADATQIQQVLLNLGVNAAQAMAGGEGRIEIGLLPVMLDPAKATVLNKELLPGGYVRLSVSDNGPGMGEAVKARVFEPFFTTKPLGEGTGLGLSVVHGIVRTHDGAIEVESEPGKGTTFHLYFPAVANADSTAMPATSAASPAPAPGQEQRVLYVDDDQALVFLVKRLLERRGYRVDGHTNQQEALAALRAEPGSFDLVVTDYNMPGMSGLDLTRAVKAIRPDLQVVLASGFVTDELKAAAAAEGVSRVIFKANAVEEFCDTVQQLVPTRAPPVA